MKRALSISLIFLVSLFVGTAFYLRPEITVQALQSIYPWIPVSALLLAIYQLKSHANSSAEKAASLPNLTKINENIRKKFIPVLNTFWLELMVILAIIFLLVLVSFFVAVENSMILRVTTSIMFFIETFLILKVIYAYKIIKDTLNDYDYKIEKEARYKEKREQLIKELREKKDDHSFKEDVHLNSYIT